MSFENDMLEKLILEGSVEVSGIDIETGNILYGFTPDVATKNPELFNSITESFYKRVISLWEKGFLNINMDDSDPTVTLTDKGESLQGTDILNAGELFVLRTIVSEFDKDK